MRQAIADAAAGDTIDFVLPAPAVIGLTSDELLIDKSLTVAGPGASSLTIEILDDGSSSLRVPEIAAGAFDVAISGVTITNGGYAVGSGLLNGSTGAVEIQDCILTANHGIAGAAWITRAI